MTSTVLELLRAELLDARRRGLGIEALAARVELAASGAALEQVSVALGLLVVAQLKRRPTVAQVHDLIAKLDDLTETMSGRVERTAFRFPEMSKQFKELLAMVIKLRDVTAGLVEYAGARFDQ